MAELIYCADGNARFAEIAIEAGFLYGAQVPNTIYYPPYFCDQDWRNPNRARYIAALAEHRPHLCSVLDWERWEQLPEVLEWAEEAAQFVEVVMIIPKVIGGIIALPRIVGGKPIRLGYSVPTRFSGTSVPIWEFYGWPVHLLGGSPHKQIALRYYLDVHSADGNYTNLKATKFCEYWTPKRWEAVKNGNGENWGNDAPYEAFRRSCQNIMEAWSKLQ